MDNLLNQLSGEQIAFVEKEVAAGNFANPLACVKELVSEAIELRQRKSIEQKLSVALDEYDRGACSEWSKTDRKSVLTKLKTEK